MLLRSTKSGGERGLEWVSFGECQGMRKLYADFVVVRMATGISFGTVLFSHSSMSGNFLNSCTSCHMIAVRGPAACFGMVSLPGLNTAAVRDTWASHLGQLAHRSLEQVLVARVFSFVGNHFSKTLTVRSLMAQCEMMAPRGGGRRAPAPLVAATRADDRAHGVGRSPAPLRVQGCRARDERRFTKPEDGQLQGGCGVLRAVRLSAGWRPPCLGGVQRRTVEQLADFAPMVQILDIPAPLMVDKLVKTLMNDVEQVFEVPKIFSSGLHPTARRTSCAAAGGAVGGGARAGVGDAGTGLGRKPARRGPGFWGRRGVFWWLSVLDTTSGGHQKVSPLSQGGTQIWV